jgi:hypothetical protein
MLVAKGSKVIKPPDRAEVADEVRRFSDLAQVMSFLDADTRPTGPVLKKLAADLNIPLPAAVKAKPAIQLYIAQTITEYRQRSHGGY